MFYWREKETSQMAWGWENYQQIVIFGWTMLLIILKGAFSQSKYKFWTIWFDLGLNYNPNPCRFCELHPHSRGIDFLMPALIAQESTILKDSIVWVSNEIAMLQGRPVSLQMSKQNWATLGHWISGWQKSIVLQSLPVVIKDWELCASDTE